VEVIDSVLLYVQLPVMNDETFYIREIQQKYTPRVRKIVIDVRDNRGGMDRCWQNILRHIVSDTLILERKLLVLNNKHVANLLKQHHIDTSTAPPPFLNEHDYQILDLSTRLVPAEESIRFDGHIYIIQNEETFSAASSLASIARQEKKIISVGTTGQESGQGLTPLIFKLKHSGLVFRLPFTLDFTGINVSDELFKQRLEIPLSESIDEYMERIWNHDYYSLEYIQKQDKMIQFIKNHRDEEPDITKKQ
jgi:hypothetical protein